MVQSLFEKYRCGQRGQLIRPSFSTFLEFEPATLMIERLLPDSASLSTLTPVALVFFNCTSAGLACGGGSRDEVVEGSESGAGFPTLSIHSFKTRLPISDKSSSRPSAISVSTMGIGIDSKY